MQKIRIHLELLEPAKAHNTVQDIAGLEHRLYEVSVNSLIGFTRVRNTTYLTSCQQMAS